MARPCQVCQHPARREIETLLANRTPCSALAQRYELHKAALERHRRKGHVKRAVQAAAEYSLAHVGAPVLARVHELIASALANVADAAASSDYAARASAINAAKGTLELAARISGEMPSAGSTTVNVALGVNVADAKEAVSLRERAASLSPAEILERAGQCLAHAVQARDAHAMRILSDLMRMLPSASTD